MTKFSNYFLGGFKCTNNQLICNTAFISHVFEKKRKINLKHVSYADFLIVVLFVHL